MNDEESIRDLASRYCWVLDERRFDDLDTVFVPDATASLGRGTQTGIGEIRALLERVLVPLRVSQHLIGSHEVTVDGDRAAHRCHFQAQHVRRGVPGGDQYIVAGRYDDDCVRTDTGWRIAHRRLTVLWTSGNPAVLEP
jgi:SnoaL-like domain